MKLTRVLSGIFVSTIGTVMVTGCEQTPATEYVAGFSTQVQVPKQFKTIQYGIKAYSADNAAGVSIDCGQAEVINGRARLPKTLGVHKIKSEAPSVEVTIAAFTADLKTLQEERGGDCASIVGVGEVGEKNPLGARILRRSQQGYRDGRVLYLPMPLKYACFDKACSESETCSAGRCVSHVRDSRIFLDYSPELAEGDTSTCFSQARCLADAQTPTLEDASTCTYSIPGTLEGMNVRAIFEGMITEVLDVDTTPQSVPGFDALPQTEKDKIIADLDLHQEGYTITAPGKFRLAPGLCDLVKGVDKDNKPLPASAKRIIALSASRACAAKVSEQPLCDDGTEVLVPAPSRLYVLLDRSVTMEEFVGDKGIEQAVGLSFSDPVFTTTEIGFSWLPNGNGTSCEVPGRDFSTPDIPFQKTLKARDAITAAMSAQISQPRSNTSSPIPALTGPNSAYVGLAKDKKRDELNALAVVLITNQDVGLACSGTPSDAAEQEATAKATAGTFTYVVQLGKEGDTAEDSDARKARVNSCNRLADENTPDENASAICFDATKASTADNEKEQLLITAGSALSAITSRLSSCVYERPGSVPENDGAKTTLRFVGIGGIKEATFNTACTGATEGTVNGWNYQGSGLVRLCGQPCKDLRDAIVATSGATAAVLSEVQKKVILPQTVLISSETKK